MIRLEDARSGSPNRVSSLPAPIGVAHPLIQHWYVVGHDRLAGAGYNRPGQSGRKTIITSPVVQVRLVGTRKAPVAFTASGSAYWLGEPAASFGLEQAQSFIWFKSRKQQARSASLVEPELQTRVMSVA